MLLALPVEIGELIAARPELAKSSDTVEWDEAQGTLKAWRRTVIGQLVIKTQPLAKPSEAELHQAMLNGIREKGLGVLNWTPEAEQLRLRLHCAAQWLPEEAWPAVDDASLLASLETWLLPQMNGVHSLRALKALDLRQALQDWRHGRCARSWIASCRRTIPCRPAAAWRSDTMRRTRQRWRCVCRRCSARPRRR